MAGPLFSLAALVLFGHIYLSTCTVLEGKDVERDLLQKGVIQSPGPECVLRKDKGTCDKNIRKYYYDQTTGFCREFSYSGCGGNLNNFQTINRCYSRCVCSNPKDKGKGLNKITRYFYNAETEACEEFKYRGSVGNSNRFVSLSQCQNTCIRAIMRRKCTSRPDPGTNCSNNSTVQFYYDKHSDCCRKFTYLGCDGNKNRFSTRPQCQKQCIVKVPITPVPQNQPPKPDICFFQSVYGDCKHTQTRYYYNNSEDRCVPFTYSGCGGNDNNFMTVFMCKRTCENNQ